MATALQPEKILGQLAELWTELAHPEKGASTASGVLARSILWQAVVPAAPAILTALAVGSALARGYLGEVTSGGGSTTFCDAADPALCDDPVTRDQYLRIVEEPTVRHAVDLAVGDLAVFGAGAFGAVLVTVAVGLLFLRPSTSVEELRVA